MSNTRKPRKVKRRTFYLLNFWDGGLPRWAAGVSCCDCGNPVHDRSETSDDTTHIGAAIVPARDLDHAVRLAWHLGCNPGGAVMGGELTLGAAELESVDVPVGVLITDTASLDAKLSHATMHLS